MAGRSFVRNVQVNNSIEVGCSFQSVNRRMVLRDVFAVLTIRKRNRNEQRVKSTSCCISSFVLILVFIDDLKFEFVVLQLTESSFSWRLVGIKEVDLEREEWSTVTGTDRDDESQ